MKENKPRLTNQKKRKHGLFNNAPALEAFKAFQKFVFDKNGESSVSVVVHLDAITTPSVDFLLESC